jgi:hypothetical protein
VKVVAEERVTGGRMRVQGGLQAMVGLGWFQMMGSM